MEKVKDYSAKDLEALNKMTEGLNLVIDKDVLDDQRALEVGTNVSDKATVSKDDKTDFETFKVIYKDAISDQCLDEYGTVDDEKLWEDTAKEMFLKSSNYIPEEDKKADGEIVKKTESKITEDTNLSARGEGVEVIVNKNQFNYNTIGLIIDTKNKQFQLVNGQTLPLGKYKSASKKAIRQKADELLSNGYTKVNGTFSLNEANEDGETFDEIVNAINNSDANLFLKGLMYEVLTTAESFDKEDITFEQCKEIAETIDNDSNYQEIFDLLNNSIVELLDSKTGLQENKTLKKETIEFDNPQEAYNVLSEVADKLDEAESLFNSLDDGEQAKIDDEFTTSVSDHFRWLITDINEILDQELKDYSKSKETFDESKECSKQITESRNSLSDTEKSKYYYGTCRVGQSIPYEVYKIDDKFYDANGNEIDKSEIKECSKQN